MIGKNIRYFRTKAGFTQEQLAYMTNTDISTISKIENNKANPSIPTLKKIAKALEIPVTKLMETNEDQCSNDS
ncbi:helix-turn-helix domain-containing protein [Zhaonella formicivorans]|uniref:helix-turn-helix domain-containing protein n=1 Tax=Zhaonella formicivorans TaxID=2528593 RepID=UPI0010E76C4F|nr:helix-turn-helix transcriptional regulator [Zhaonella formicivorans]